MNDHLNFSALIPVVEELGALLLDWRNDQSAKKLHSKIDFKTEADRRAHIFMAEQLEKLFPGVAVISEEDVSHSDIRPNKYWIIDPIDGTASWYGGFDGFVTQAAYIENDVPVFGIIHCPSTGSTWTALRGHGAKLNGNTISKLNPSGRLVVTDNTPSPHGVAAEVMEVLNATGYVESGSLGLKSVLVADGTADLFIKRVVVRDWDIAPAAAILKEVGGYVALPSGKPFEFSGSMVKEEGVIIARDISLLKQAIKAISDIDRTKEANNTTLD